MLAGTQKMDVEGRVREAAEIALQVGRDARNFREHGGRGVLRVENKGPQDFVTIADRLAEDSIRSRLAAVFPGDGFMGEESGGTSTANGLWVVDPIDGTTNYIRGFRHWGVSIAFVANGQVQGGVVYDAAFDHVYSAIAGGGAFKNGHPIQASPVTEPAQAVAILGHSRRTSFTDYQSISAELYALGIDYRRMGAAAIGLVRVADGVADLYYERHLNAWDMLAGALIAREAGANVYMPRLDVMLEDGGAVLACAPGMDQAFGFVRSQAGPACELMAVKRQGEG